MTNAALRGEALSGFLASIEKAIFAVCNYDEFPPNGAPLDQYDVVICDAAEASRPAHALALSLSQERRDIPVIVVTGASDDQSFEYFDSGASGVVRWDSTSAELCAGLLAVAAGNRYASQEVLRELIMAPPRSTHARADAARRLEDLTAKESRVVNLLLQGMTNQEIAARLFLAEPTVKAHLGRIMAKWGARDRLQVALLALAATDPPVHRNNPQVGKQ